MSSPDTFKHSLSRAREYGLEEFLEIIGELSQESTKKGRIDRASKELITLGIALAKQCRRCIDIHGSEARRLGAGDGELSQVRKIALFLKASPSGGGEMWESWEDSWREYVLGRGPIEHHVRELIALGIALVEQRRDHIRLHARSALEFGTPPEEIFEVMPIALLMDGAPALSQIPHLVEALDAPALQLSA
ncbi:carboxymuconolactone decarboxylase family protein [Marichromatium gracile]|uniref:AhpD family alkylhydroperoxidase n=1 Tax=Marichromatium gracile TaxID=1048 RepID=A0A4R4ACI1_MARGR|nr:MULTISPECIES: carboxymuconolactone decarboxylase family protein [Marichromatium]MBO8086974.1 carboxymuconolactone decarboxylase family protein [Marichromatium sp.]MBK1710463.1 alkylhydroperoxidase [Marichromatium gracile]MCF1183772.1 carboxymuconolactone decarboxylase family protein [Marichromatium gracile]RNE89320.1 alkylhydroperoxidase [Marichromatium sp. AB31]RNE91324.1 alkylhydroperoxidase [Marichromatium sp. AB32]